MIDVLNYKNYRQFLLDFLAEKKSNNSNYSIRYFAKKADIDHSNLIRVLQGKRELSINSIPRCLEVMKLKGRKAEYFRLLVMYQRAKDQDKAEKYLERLLTVVGNGKMELEINQYEFYRTWYHNAIYHLIGVDGFDNDYKALAKKLTPKILEDQARKSVNLLEKIGVLERNTENKLIQSCHAITTGDEWKSTIIHSFQKSTLEMAINSLVQHPRFLRDFSTMTMGIAEKDMIKVKKILKEARSAIIDVVKESEPVDSVYHLNIQLFPMAFSKKGNLK